MCEKCNCLEKEWAQAIFDDVEFRSMLTKDLEIEHLCNGDLLFKGEEANKLVNFLMNQGKEDGVEWEEDITEDQKFESAHRVVGNFLDLVGKTQSHLLRFSIN